jgi:hypothetical protein
VDFQAFGYNKNSVLSEEKKSHKDSFYEAEKKFYQQMGKVLKDFFGFV